MKNSKFGSLFEQLKFKDEKTARLLESMTEENQSTVRKKEPPQSKPVIRQLNSSFTKATSSNIQSSKTNLPGNNPSPDATVSEILQGSKGLLVSDVRKKKDPPTFLAETQLVIQSKPVNISQSQGKLGVDVVESKSHNFLPEQPLDLSQDQVPLGVEEIENKTPFNSDHPGISQVLKPSSPGSSQSSSKTTFPINAIPLIQRPNWYEQGSVTQFSINNLVEERIIIGFDFGTTCCKAVIRTPDRDHSRAIAVQFELSKRAPYFLPTCLWIDKSGKTAISIESPGGICFPDLKITLLDNPRQVPDELQKQGINVRAEVATVCYLALALRIIRQHFLHKYAAVYGKLKLGWELNLGIPAKSYEDSPIQQLFKRIACAAWKLSVMSTPITIHHAESVLAESQLSGFSPGIHPDLINIVPELAGEATGFIKSPLAPKDLYVLVDIGGTTLDVTSFHLYDKNFDQKGALLTAEVDRLGALILHKSRLKLINEKMGTTKYSQKFEDQSPLFCLPEQEDYIVPERLKASLESHDISFQKQCEKTLIRTICALRDKRYATSPAWDRGLPVLLSGGGSFAPFYKKIVQIVEKWASSQFCKKGFRISHLPKPSNLEAINISETNYHRLAVAFGLSIPFDDICHIDPLKKTSDIIRNKEKSINWEKNYIDKDCM